MFSLPVWAQQQDLAQIPWCQQLLAHLSMKFFAYTMYLSIKIQQEISLTKN
jgi:hypothetical protein